VRSLVTLRRLPPTPPNTLVRAIAIALRAASDAPRSDRSALHVLCDSDEPLLAGVANWFASYLWESEGDQDSALKAAERMREAFENRGTPWMGAIAHSRIGELCLQVDRGDKARRHLRVALLVAEELGAWGSAVRVRWALALANLQLGAIDEAEHWLEQVALNRADEPVGVFSFNLGARAEILLARGEVEAGLRLWRSRLLP
jgi:tetratricopeptide (TPR) repeat protein